MAALSARILAVFCKCAFLFFCPIITQVTSFVPHLHCLSINGQTSSKFVPQQKSPYHPFIYYASQSDQSEGNVPQTRTGVSHPKKRRSWEESYELLKQYKQQYGHCNVSRHYQEDPKLSWWVDGQRKRCKSLSKERREKLEGIGFSFKLQRTWEENFELLKQYKQEHGHCNVPERYPEDPQLGCFVQQQRLWDAALSEDQRNQLEELGFIFEGAHIVQHNEKWEKMFERLQDYKEEYGDCLVRRNWWPDQTLANWVQKQRYNKKRRLLSKERQSKLNSIDFVWQVREGTSRDNSKNDKMWHKQYEKLIAFKEKHNHTMVPQGFQEDGPLGTWVNRQKDLYKKGSLRDDRKELLEDIAFTWNLDQEREDAWNRKYKEVKEFYDTNQSSVVGLQAQNPQLYNWLYVQRIYNANGELHPKRKAKLDKLNNWDIVD